MSDDHEHHLEDWAHGILRSQDDVKKFKLPREQEYSPDDDATSHFANIIGDLFQRKIKQSSIPARPDHEANLGPNDYYETLSSSQ